MDDLLTRGYRHLSVLDLSEEALQTARDRLRAAAWLRGDVRATALEPRSLDLWHDQAVFHILTDEADRAAYVRAWAYPSRTTCCRPIRERMTVRT